VRRTVCRLSDLPARGGYLVEVGGQAIALFRVGGAVYAIDNVCPHREGPLAYGDLRGTTVFCPLHAWGFDVRSGACDEFPGVRVRTYPVHVQGDEIQVEL